MSRTLPALAALLVLCGCGAQKQEISPLQRYDRMKRELAWITSASGIVARDAQQLRVAMAHADIARTRAAAARLKRWARPYSRRAGAAGNAVRSLAGEAPSGSVRTYLTWVTAALSWQWVEGVALVAVANQAWLDPLSIRGNDAHRLAADVRWAQQAVRAAIRAGRSAEATRRHNRLQFRYTVVRPAAGRGLQQGG